MKTVALLAVCALSFSAKSFAAEPTRLETSEACVARTNALPSDCFVTNAKGKFEVCRQFMQLGVVFGNIDTSSGCAQFSGKSDLADHYQATLKQFAGNAEALNLAKNYYALWRAAMMSLVPSFREPRTAYDARISRQSAELDAAGERLALEK